LIEIAFSFLAASRNPAKSGAGVRGERKRERGYCAFDRLWINLNPVEQFVKIPEKAS
jgi:hypothetical protein